MNNVIIPFIIIILKSKKKWVLRTRDVHIWVKFTYTLDNKDKHNLNVVNLC